MLQIQTILVYTLLTIVMYVFSRKAYTTQRKGYQILPIIAFILVFGLRYSVGIDWENYRSIYEEELYGMSFSEMLETRYEIGFIIIVYLCQYLQLPTYMLFVSFSAIQILFLYNALKDEKALPYIYLVFILSGIAIQGFCNVMRQDIAFCIFLYALTFAKDHRLIPYLLLCTLAACFHKSAIIVFPIYFLWVRRSSIFNRPITQITIFLICIIASFASPIQYILGYLERIISLVGFEKYTDIAEDMTTSSYMGPIRIMLILTYLIIFYHNKQIKEYFNSEMFNRFYDLFFIGSCCYFFFLGNMMFGRITLYFTNFTFIILGYALYYYIQQPKTRATLLGLISVSLSLIVSYSSLIFKCQQNTDAYVSYFQKDLHPLKDKQRDSMFNNR